MNDSRTILRSRLISARDDLPLDARRRAAEQIVERIREVLSDRTPGYVAGYLSYGGELDVRPTLGALAEAGWRTVLPVVRPRFVLEFSPWSEGDDLVPNRFGIDEPTGPPVEPTRLDVVLVPGVGFSTGGDRIGHGAGFYDRFLGRVIESGADLPLLIGVAHELQVVELPAPEEWDVPMDCIVTPDRVIWP